MSGIVCYAYCPSPIGDLLMVAQEDFLTGLYMGNHQYGPRVQQDWQQETTPVLAAAHEQLTAYFAGTRREFTLPLRPAGTPFQQAVWQELQQIPYGTTTTYGALAQRLGRPAASRAVGLANGHNPISIIVPCHRVIGSNGKLVGYGGGLDRKRTLLRLEGVSLPDDQPLLFDDK